MSYTIRINGENHPQYSFLIGEPVPLFDPLTIYSFYADDVELEEIERLVVGCVNVRGVIKGERSMMLYCLLRANMKHPRLESKN